MSRAISCFLLVTGMFIIAGGGQIHKSRYQVAIHDGYTDFCGGSILNDKYVVSSAKCFQDTNGTIFGPLYVFVGSIKSPVDGTGAVIEEIYMPQMFGCIDNHCHPADIAVVKLRGRLRLEAYSDISPVKLPEVESEDTQEIYGFKVAVASGYCPRSEEPESSIFKFSNGERFYPGKLKIEKVDILQQNECEYAWLGLAYIYSTQMCAKSRKNSTLRSGSCTDFPGYGLVYKNTLIGVASFGGELCSKNDDCSLHPVVYTKVSSYLWFIKGALSGKGDYYIRRFKIDQYNDYKSGANVQNYVSYVVKYFTLLTIFVNFKGTIKQGLN